MNEKYLPIGTVVLLNGATKKVMIIILFLNVLILLIDMIRSILINQMLMHLRKNLISTLKI